jgi:hypothetical protein
VPASIITPSSVETERLGTLNFFEIGVLHADRAGAGTTGVGQPNSKRLLTFS